MAKRMHANENYEAKQIITLGGFSEIITHVYSLT